MFKVFDVLRRKHKQPAVFDFTQRYWGHSVQIHFSDSANETLYLWGHSWPRPNKGDLLLTQDKAGNRYIWKVITIEHYRDPNDMWYAGVKLKETDNA